MPGPAQRPVPGAAWSPIAVVMALTGALTALMGILLLAMHLAS
ncbi:MAG: hypothetical protein ABWY78_19630 [Microvirga sp.]